MKKYKMLITLITLVLYATCAFGSWHDWWIKEGMTTEQVIDKWGTPDFMKQTGNSGVWFYDFSEPKMMALYVDHCYITFIDGVVSSVMANQKKVTFAQLRKTKLYEDAQLKLTEQLAKVREIADARKEDRHGTVESVR